MRILQICNKSPYPPKEGGTIAMNNITEGLINAGHSVKVLAINTPKYFIDDNLIPKEYKEKTQFEAVYIDTGIKLIPAFVNSLSVKSYHIQRFISKEFEQSLIKILNNNSFDIVQLETIYVTPYIETIRKNSHAKIILRAHNIEYLIWERITQGCENILKRFILKKLTKHLKNYELSTINKCDGITAITLNDAEFFKQSGCAIPVIDIPFGVNIENYKLINNLEEFPSLFHLGSMDWIPNQEGIKWFLENCWTKINLKYSDLKFYLAGRNMPDWIEKKHYPNVIVVGEVEDALKFIRSKSIMIVPLLSGSGIRVKIIEGMALGKTIISTEIGAEGIHYKNKVNILIANSPDDFLDAISECIIDKTKCDLIGKNARHLILEEYNNDMLINKLITFYQTILNTK